jgi:hypothetical protein
MELSNCVCERSDIKRIEKLNALTNPVTFWDDVRRLTKRVSSDHTLRRWQALAEMRYDELSRK